MSHSVFPDGDFRVDPELVFAAVPFEGQYDTLYREVRDLVVDHCYLRCVRADAISRSGIITAEIWQHINEAICIVADLSERNANVFYEVGLAHALGKPVILLSRNDNDVPFDLRHLRIIQYDAGAGLSAVRSQLLAALRSCVSTLPKHWDRRQPTEGEKPLVRISSVSQPETAAAGQPVEIVVRARTEDVVAREGYLSVSFPYGVEDQDVVIVQTDVEQRVGRVKDPWCNGRVILDYPIAEVFAVPWESRREHFIKVQFRSRRRGWLQYFVSVSSSDDTGRWTYDPGPDIPHIDQRGEHVLCGVIDVM